MGPIRLDERPLLPSLTSVYRPIEEYWESFGPADVLGPDPQRVLDPLDALLIHLVLDLVPGRPVLIDAAAEDTGGASGVIGLAHRHVRRVLAVSASGSEEADRALSALRESARVRAPEGVPLEVLPPAELASRLTDRDTVVIVADARGGEAASLAGRVRQWLDDLPDALVLVLGLGRVGECSAIEALLGLCPAGSGRRFRLVRELGEVLVASHLGVVARHERLDADDILLRVQALFAGNLSVLELLKTANQATLRAARAVEESSEQAARTVAVAAAEKDQLMLAVWEARNNSPGSLAEIEALKQAADASSEQAARALATAAAEKDRLLLAVWEANEQAALSQSAAAEERDRLMREVGHWRERAAHPLVKIRRRLSAGRAGRVLRKARKYLSPRR